MSVPSLGIIGGGFVGGSVAKGFKHYTDVKVYDIDPSRKTHEFEDVISQDVLVVALNTPMDYDTGQVDVSLVEHVLRTLNGALKGWSWASRKPVLVRSTVPPTALHQWHERFNNFELIFCPEFLTERTAEHDFQQSNRLIFGVPEVNVELGHPSLGQMAVKELFEARFPMVPQYFVPYRQASLVKYMTNVFFCTKVALLNEFAQVAEAMGLDYNETFGLVMMDQRIGRSHWQVPGHDGKRGFGGHCFPKDINGYFHIAKMLGVKPTVSEAAWEKNLEVRPEKDWEADVGRAINKGEKK